jgi:hypothetical protein
LGSGTCEPVAWAAIEKQLPFLYLSGYSAHDGRFARWPGIDVLVKPISAVTIARRICAILANGKTPPA